MGLIYAPSLKGKYDLIRADLISTPGVITKQVIDNIIDADLVIIDFTPNTDSSSPNSNVMYEAAIRHIAQKPIIQIAPFSLRMPFDIKDFRCIGYNPEDLLYPKKLKIEIKKAIKAVESPSYKPPDIIGHTFDLDRIVSDPEKFIQILKDKFFLNNPSLTRFEDTINYGGLGGNATESFPGSITFRPSPGGSGYTDIFGSFYSTVCPNCSGRAYQITTLGTQINMAGEQQTYKCSKCGLIFYK